MRSAAGTPTGESWLGCCREPERLVVCKPRGLHRCQNKATQFRARNAAPIVGLPVRRATKTRYRHFADCRRRLTAMTILLQIGPEDGGVVEPAPDLASRCAQRELQEDHRPDVAQRFVQYNVADAFDGQDVTRRYDRNMGCRRRACAVSGRFPAPSLPAATANLLPAQIHSWTAFRFGPSAFPEVLGSVKCAVLSIKLRQGFALR